MKISKVTPIFVVEKIEPAIQFWTALGWKKAVAVPHKKTIGFVLFTHDGRELMLQTRASIDDDIEGVKALKPKYALYMDVPSLKKALASLKSAKGTRVLIEERETFYGAKEAWVVDAAGVLVGFAEKK